MKKFNWLLSGAIAVGLGGVVVLPAHAKDRRDDVVKEGESERTVGFDDLPKVVRKAFERERGSNTLSDIKLVHKEDGETFYRAYIEEHRTQRWIRVTPDGDVKGETDDRVKHGPARVVQETPRERPGAVVRASVARPEVVNFDDLPGHAKEAIGREARGLTRRGDVYKSINRAGMPIYSAEVSDGNRTRMVTVDALGKLYTDVDDTKPGEKTVDYESVPFAAKKAIGQETGGGNVQKVVQGTDAGGHTFYTALVRHKNGPYWVTVDDGGNFVAENAAR